MQVDEFSALFERFQRSAFRVEARDHYDVDDERDEFAAFLAGKELAPQTEESNAWLRQVAEGRAAGRLIERIRIVGEPLSLATTPALSSRPTATTSKPER